MDFENLTAPCGIACFECVAYKARSSELIKQRISTGLGMDYEQSDCNGCRARHGKGFFAAKNNVFPEGQCNLLNENGDCKIYLCAVQHQVHNCSQCAEFPCDNFQPLADRADKIPHNLKVYNLCLIRRMGLEKWAREKAAQIWNDYKTKTAGK